MKIGIVSGWHVHTQSYAEQIQQRDDCVITAFWDEEEERGRGWAEKLDCRWFADYDEFLADPGVEGVVITAPTAMHRELILKAVRAGKHIFTEKVLTFTEAEALEIKTAVEENGVRFAISFPYKSRGDSRLVKQLTEAGILGKITYARVRLAHDGSSSDWLPAHFYDRRLCGGGAMMDLGAHPMYLLVWLLGRPQKITSAFGNLRDRDVEENAVSVLSYADGTIAVAETSFVSKNCPFIIEISGTKGSLLLRDGVSYASEETGNRWVSAEVPEDLPLPLHLWLDNSPLSYGIDEAVLLSAMMEQAYQPEKN